MSIESMLYKLIIKIKQKQLPHKKKRQKYYIQNKDFDCIKLKSF